MKQPRRTSWLWQFATAAGASALAAVLLAGCGGGGSSSPAANGTPFTEDGVLSRSVTSPSGDGIVTTVSILKSDYRLGETVTLTLTRANTGSSPAQIGTSAGEFDVLVESSSESGTIFDTDYGKAIPGNIEITTLAPGESSSLTDTWNLTNNAGNPVAPGVYRVTIGGDPSLPIYVTVHAN